MFHHPKILRQENSRTNIAKRSNSALAKSIHSYPNKSLSFDANLQRSIGNQGMIQMLKLQGRVSAQDRQAAVTSGERGASSNLVSTNISVNQSAPHDRIMRVPAEPYVAQINVDLNTPQNVRLDWQGTPPSDVRSAFRCSTGKGYGDPDDPPGICNRACCTSGANPCAAPNDQRRSRGSCCTPTGNFVVQSKDRDHAVEGGTIPFWMYFYRTRGIAIHEYSPVNGTPLSHGCVRLDSVNAEMLFNYSHANVTRVSVTGTATPACPAGSGVACSTSASIEPSQSLEEGERLAGIEREEVDLTV